MNQMEQMEYERLLRELEKLEAEIKAVKKKLIELRTK
jgi:hypothetical protein